MILFTVNLTVVYSFFDAYMNTMDCSIHNMLTRIFELIKLPLEMSLLIIKQLQHGVFRDVMG